MKQEPSKCDICAIPHLCCTQTIPILPSEVERLKRLNPAVPIKLYRGNEFYMASIHELCIFHADGRCQIYAERPESCRRFDCSPAFVMLRTRAQSEGVALAQDEFTGKIGLPMVD